MPTEQVPADDEWFTIRQAGEAHQKSVESIRRWLREDAPAIRTRHVRGVKYVHAGDLAAAAERRPAGTFEEQVPCAAGGHQPVTELRLDPAGWVTLTEASEMADRSKTTLMRWADDDQVRWCRCACERRRYIWAGDIPDALTRHT